jgi:hypothetical protein
MAHWAEINENNVVVRVVVTSNDLPDEGESWLVSTLGGTWVQTSYNANFRGKFAGMGDVYDADLDEFLTPVSAEVTDEVV